MIKPSPYDSAAFGMPAWELGEYSAAALQQAASHAGLQTIKVNPLAHKGLLQQHGFYYTDTLLETCATAARLRDVPPRAGLSVAPLAAGSAQAEQALAICANAFEHGRFHRDFQLPRAGAELRYANWLRQLLAANAVYGLYADGELAGFIGTSGNSFVLHAVAAAQRGKGLAKHWWHLAAQQMFAAGHTEVRSSISAANLAVLNLYASLGFTFQHPLDVYHRVVK